MNLLMLFLMFVAVVAIVGMMIAANRASRRRNLTGPVCGGCGYSVTGLAGMTCPECGEDLRTVGILTPRTLHSRGTAAGVLMFTLLLAFIAIVTTSAVESVVPVRHSYNRHLHLGPVSSGYRSVFVQTSRESWSGNFTPTEVTVELEGVAIPSSTVLPDMSVRADGGYEFTAGGSRVVGRGKFDQHAVIEWLKAAGIDTSTADIQRKAARIAAEVRIAARSGRTAMSRSSSYSSGSSSGGNSNDVFQNRTFSETSYSTSPAAPLIAMLLFWFAVWIWGLWYLVARGARRRREGNRGQGLSYPAAARSQSDVPEVQV